MKEQVSLGNLKPRFYIVFPPWHLLSLLQDNLMLPSTWMTPIEFWGRLDLLLGELGIFQQLGFFFFCPLLSPFSDVYRSSISSLFLIVLSNYFISAFSSHLYILLSFLLIFILKDDISSFPFFSLLSLSFPLSLILSLIYLFFTYCVFV